MNIYAKLLNEHPVDMFQNYKTNFHFQQKFLNS